VNYFPNSINIKLRCSNCGGESDIELPIGAILTVHWYSGMPLDFGFYALDPQTEGGKQVFYKVECSKCKVSMGLHGERYLFPI